MNMPYYSVIQYGMFPVHKDISSCYTGSLFSHWMCFLFQLTESVLFNISFRYHNACTQGVAMIYCTVNKLVSKWNDIT